MSCGGRDRPRSNNSTMGFHRVLLAIHRCRHFSNQNLFLSKSFPFLFQIYSVYMKSCKTRITCHYPRLRDLKPWINEMFWVSIFRYSLSLELDKNALAWHADNHKLEHYPAKLQSPELCLGEIALHHSMDWDYIFFFSFLLNCWFGLVNV